MRKVQRDGTWWAQRSDGSWVRWSLIKGDWEQSLPPPGLEAELPPEPARPIPQPVTDQVLPVNGDRVGPVRVQTLNPGVPSAFSLLLSGLATYFRLVAPALALGLLFTVFFPFLMMFLFMGGEAPMPPENAVTILAFGAVLSLFLAVAISAYRVLAAAKGLSEPLTWVVPAVVGLIGIPIAWAVSGNHWIGSTSGRVGMHAGLAGLGFLVEAYFRGVAALRASVARHAPWWDRFPVRFHASFRVRREVDLPPEFAGSLAADAWQERARREDRSADALGFSPSPHDPAA